MGRSSGGRRTKAFQGLVDVTDFPVSHGTVVERMGIGGVSLQVRAEVGDRLLVFFDLVVDECLIGPRQQCVVHAARPLRAMHHHGERVGAHTLPCRRALCGAADAAPRRLSAKPCQALCEKPLRPLVNTLAGATHDRGNLRIGTWAASNNSIRPRRARVAWMVDERCHRSNVWRS